MVHQWSADSIRRLLEEVVMRQISSLEKTNSDEGSSSESDPGWAASLLLKIVDNIQVTVESLHFRYECPAVAGKFSVLFIILLRMVHPEPIVSVGATIDRLAIRSTDATWKSTDFIVRPKGQHLVHKKITLEAFSVYLDPAAAASVNGPDAGSRMNALVARRGQDPPLARDKYVLLPMGAEVRAVRNSKPGVGEPGLTTRVMLEDSNLQLHQAQFRALLAASKTFEAANDSLRALSHPGRPALPARRGGQAESWWAYFASRVAHLPLATKAAQCRSLRSRLQVDMPGLRRLYTDLAIRLLAGEDICVGFDRSREHPNCYHFFFFLFCVSGRFPDAGYAALSPEEAGAMAAIERALPFEVLANLCRAAAVAAVAADARRKAEAKAAKASSAAKSWSAWLLGSSASSGSVAPGASGAAEGDEGDISVGAMAAEAAALADEQGDSGDIPRVTLSVESGVTLRLWGEGEGKGGGKGEGPLLTATSRTRAELFLDVSDGSFCLAVQLAELEVRDHVTPTPEYPLLLTTQTADDAPRSRLLWDERPVMVMDALETPLDEASDIAIGVESKGSLSVKVREFTKLRRATGPHDFCFTGTI